MICGVITNICVESTVRSAEQRDFDVLVAADCTAAPAEAQDASLASMASVFATVDEWRKLPLGQT
jgi:nicotinamidase-related amidase